MAEEKGKDEKGKAAAPAAAVAPVVDDPIGLVTRAAERLEARRGHRNKTWLLMAAELRALAARLQRYE
jgi:hypothetical protein